jgi:hypothetical protein
MITPEEHANARAHASNYWASQIPYLNLLAEKIDKHYKDKIPNYSYKFELYKNPNRQDPVGWIDYFARKGISLKTFDYKPTQWTPG